jgi:2-polyprenyl-6-hydroxyphenyl methylase/3-demethylubiquinone-9 3-methyltransferase
MSSIGSTVRRAFGPYERHVAEWYRRIFVDLDDLTRQIREWVNPTSILEIGCGEGALAERLARGYPAARYLGIDITPHVGRLFEHPPRNVSFRQVTAQELAREAKGQFDLVVISDVIHHVPRDLRPQVLAAAKDLLAGGGHLVLKDWVRRPTLIHAMSYFADVYIGGDRNTHYLDLDEQRSLIESTFGQGVIRQEADIAPWTQNHAFLIERRGE